jgi:hypothetical protein
MQGNEVAMHNAVAQPGQPEGIPTGSPANVSDRRRRRQRRQVTEHDLPGSLELEPARACPRQPVGFLALLVMLMQRSQEKVVSHTA